MLRIAVFSAGALYLLAAAFLVARGANLPALWLGVSGSCLVFGTLVERWHYHPRIDSTRGRWQHTGEQFLDPATGKEVDVLYNPDTGERDYVDR